VLSRLAAVLRAVAGGAHAGQRLHGRILVVPAVNVLGVNTRHRRWPFDGSDINRMFPGSSEGETTQRIARAVLELTQYARHRIDVHCSNADFEELPQVRLYAPEDDERSLAWLFGLPAIIEYPLTSIVSSTISHAWRACAGNNFVLQAGQAGALQPAVCERLFRSLVAFLYRTGVLEGVELSAAEEDVHYFGPDQTVPLISAHAGLLVSPLEVGRWIQRGQSLGQVYDGFEGTLIADVRAPAAGLLSGIRRQPLLFDGDLVARIQTVEAVVASADSYIGAQGQ
jgi:predicted deacylase